MDSKTKKLTAMAMLCAAAYTAAAVGRIPLVLFLKYDPKDVVIAIGGLMFGPLAALSISAAAALLEMFTISENGILGFVMNVVSSASFACTAAWVYGKGRGTLRAVAGPLCGWGCMVAMMLGWNYLAAPIYMGCSRGEVAELLLPVFLPFNLIKGGANAALTMLLYRPVSAALRRLHLADAAEHMK